MLDAFVFIATNSEKYEIEILKFSVLMYSIPGIDWDTRWYTLGHCIIFIRLSVCMLNNINKHRP